MTEGGESPAKGPPNVVLVGMMGSGKSSVGRLLADWLGVRLNDIDATIEYEAGRAIPKIFEAWGEGRFRELEREAIARAVRDRPCVIATGGGAFADPVNREALKSGGVVVYLRATPERLAARVRHASKRPLLHNADPLDRIRELLAQREASYLEADHVVETDGVRVDEVVAKILDLLGRSG